MDTGGGGFGLTELKRSSSSSSENRLGAAVFAELTSELCKTNNIFLRGAKRHLHSVKVKHNLQNNTDINYAVCLY